jgi:hypothetical protein
VSWKAHLQSGLMLLGLVALLVLLGFGGLRFYRAYQSDLGIEETGVVTVVSVIGGHSGEWGGLFDHRVRLESGSEGIMTFREMFPRGSPGLGELSPISAR